MTTVADVCAFLDAFAPPALAAEWDNVGLLVGDAAQKVERIMTCLTITPAVTAEAIRERADLIVTHHPLPFKPLKRLTADHPAGRRSWAVSSVTASPARRTRWTRTRPIARSSSARDPASHIRAL